MMQLTKAADYAIRVMIHLATCPPGTRASRTELAFASGCPDPFLSKVLQTLTRAGLVVSFRGSSGGFELASERGGVTILEIVEAVEGPVHLNACLVSENECRLQEWCPAYTIWNEAQNALKCVLRAASLVDLARIYTETRNARPGTGTSGSDRVSQRGLEVLPRRDQGPE